MRRCLLPAGTLFAVLLLAVNVARAQTLHLPPATRTMLGNGIHIVLMEYHRAPALTVNAIFPGGSAEDAREKVGTASMTAELLRKGTETRSAPQIAEEIDYLGGSLGAFAGDDRVTVSLDLLAKDAGRGLDLFADVLRHPTFPAEELERERQLRVAALDALSENPRTVASRVATETVYSGHPYGFEPTISTLQALNREDLAAYYRRFLVPDRMILVAVGDFKTAEMLAKLKARFGDWPKGGGSLPAVPAVTRTPRKLVLIDKPDATQTQVRWVRVAFPRASPDYYAAQIADSILGGGFTSRLTDEIRVNRSLTYGIGSSFDPEKYGGRFGVSSFTKIETTRALIDATNAVLRKAAAQGFSPAELAKVKGYIAGQFAIGMQSPEALARSLGEIAFYGLPDDYLSTYLPRMRAVTLADANRVAKRYFAPESLSLVLVAPAAKVRSQISGLGRFETRRVETVGK